MKIVRIVRLVFALIVITSFIIFKSDKKDVKAQSPNVEQAVFGR